MHVGLAQFEAEGHDAVLHRRVPVRTVSTPPAGDSPFEPSVYGERQIRWPAICAAVAAHMLLIGTLMSLDLVPVPLINKRPPTVVDLIELPPEPPEVVLQQPKLEPVKVTQPPPVSPPPMVRVPLANSAPIVATPEPPPQRTVVVAPTATGPVSVSDLSASMIAAKSPKYPIESRRKREQGTVVLTVVVGSSGSVVDVSIAKSSGFERLDKAALAAVRGWRWSPTVRNGQPVMVKGFVDIPFVLTG
jgi:protein TonB